MAEKTNWKKKFSVAVAEKAELAQGHEALQHLYQTSMKRTGALDAEVERLKGELEIAEAVNEFHIANTIKIAKDFSERWRNVRASMRSVYEAFRGAFHGLEAQVEGGDLPSGSWVQGDMIQRCEHIREQMEYLRGRGYRAIIEDQLNEMSGGPRKVTMEELVGMLERGEKIGKE